MMVITCVDVIFRAFDHPIFGAVEIVSFMATLVLACAMPLTDHEHGHVGVDLFVRKFSPRTQAWYSGIGNLVAGTLFGLVCWQMFLYGNTVKDSGEVSMSLQFPRLHPHLRGGGGLRGAQPGHFQRQREPTYKKAVGK